MKHPVPPLSLLPLYLFPLLLLIPAAAPTTSSPEDIARQQEQRQREEQLRERMQPAGHVRQEERHILFMKNQIEWNNDDQDKMLL